MTFLEEELKTVETSPDYCRVLRIYIKHQIYTLFQKLSEIGEESFALTANACDGTFSHVGSSKGEVFLDKTQDIQWKFLSFCSSTDNQPVLYDAEYRIDSDTSRSQDTTYSEKQSPALRQSGTLVTNQQQTSLVVSKTEPDNVDDEEEENIYDVPQNSNDYTEEDNDNYRAQTGGAGVFAREPSDFTSDVTGDEHAGIMDKDQVVFSADQGQAFDLPTSPRHSDRLGVKRNLHVMNIKSEPLDVSSDNEEDTFDRNFKDEFYRNEQEFSHSVLSDNQILRRLQQTSKDRSEIAETVSRISEIGSIPDQLLYSDSFGAMQQTNRQCSFCDRSFPTPSHLRNHLRTHTGERPYQCRLCHKNFNRNHHLHLHMRTHTGEKPFKCHMCHKCFSQKGSRDRHQLTHFDLRPDQSNLALS